MAILLSFRTLGPCAYGITERRSSRASFRSCIRRRSRALILNRVAVAAASAAAAAAAATEADPEPDDANSLVFYIITSILDIFYFALIYTF